MTEREELYNEISMLVSDEDTRSRIYIILSRYEIQKRETAVALLQEDRNELLIKKFIVAKTVKGCTERTIECYRTQINTIIQKIGKTVDDITTDDIRLYTATRMYRDGVSKTTVGNEIRYLRSFFQFLAAEEIIQKNPMARIEEIKKEKTKKEAFTELEIEKMRSELKTNRDRAIFEMMLSTGCRVSELVNIRIDEINGNEILIHGKGNKDRKVYMNAKSQYIVEKYMLERSDNNPYLFPSVYFDKLNEWPRMKRKDLKDWYKNKDLVSENEHLTRDTVEQIIRKYGRKAGVHAHPHKFRRTCATFALRRGMPIEQVSKMLGHESISTTQIYLDLSENDLKESHRKYVV